MKEEITIAAIEKLAQLSQLELCLDEKNHLLGEVRGIVELLNGCDLVDTEGVNCGRDCLGLNDLRDDECGECLDRDYILENMKNTKDGFVVTPKVVD